MQDYTAADNVQNEYPPSEPCIHENYSTGAACCGHSWQISYSKSVSLGSKCYEETRVVLRPPTLDTTTIRASALIKGITNWVISEVSHIMEKLESICVKFIKDVVLRNIIQFIKNAESAIRTRIIIILDEIFNKINHIFNEDEDYRAVKAILAEAKEKLIRKWEDRERITEDALQSMKESVKVKFDKLVKDKFQVVKYEPERGSIKLKVHLGSAELQILQNELRTIQRILKQRLEV
ncbi:UNVERIFIED_CONTAM: hypothetical protein NCL1_19485 [Trichonephila clavipes]